MLPCKKGRFYIIAVPPLLNERTLPFKPLHFDDNGITVSD